MISFDFIGRQVSGRAAPTVAGSIDFACFPNGFRQKYIQGTFAVPYYILLPMDVCIIFHSNSLELIPIVISFLHLCMPMYSIIHLASNVMGKKLPRLVGIMLFACFPNVFGPLSLCVRSLFGPRVGRQGFACFPNGFKQASRDPSVFSAPKLARNP